MRALFGITAFFLALAAVAFFGLQFFSKYARQPGPLAAPVVTFIAPGTGVRQMAVQLAQERVIAEPLAFVGLVKMQGVGAKLQAGEYDIPAHASLQDVIAKLSSGDVYRRELTIPEGLWSSEIIRIINEADAMKGEVAEVPAEGSILPDTYAYIRGDDRAKIITRAQKAMADTLDAAWAARAPNLPFATKEEALIMASVVEKETGLAAERPRIAGVFINRLRQGMMLQSDPTVIYAVTNGQTHLDRVLYAHLAVDSPYNTYRHAGLPPGPICNPGKAAIEAVLKPEVHDYLYFVADGSGGHAFAATLTEHNANVAKWRAVQRAARQGAAEAVKAPGTVPDKAEETPVPAAP